MCDLTIYRVDEWMLSYLREFDGNSLVSIAKGGLSRDQLADEEEKKHQAEVAKSSKRLVERLGKALDGKVKEVRVTGRLVDSPACVVVDENELSPHLLRMLQSAGQTAPARSEERRVGTECVSPCRYWWSSYPST